MIKAIGIALVAAVAFTSAGPSYAKAVGDSEAVLTSSSYLSMWHEHGRGFVVTDRARHATTVPPRREVLSACTSPTCRAAVVAYYHGLRHQWRLFNRAAFALVRSFPPCSADVTDACILPPTHEHPEALRIVLGGATYTAFNAVEILG